MPYITEQVLKYSDGTSETITYTEADNVLLSPNETIMEETTEDSVVEEVVEESVETPVEEVTA